MRQLPHGSFRASSTGASKTSGRRSLEAGRERSTEEIVVSIDHHLVLVLAEMKEWVGGFRVSKDNFTNFFRKRSMVISLDNRESMGLNLLYSISFGNC